MGLRISSTINWTFLVAVLKRCFTFLLYNFVFLLPFHNFLMIRIHIPAAFFRPEPKWGRGAPSNHGNRRWKRREMKGGRSKRFSLWRRCHKSCVPPPFLSSPAAMGFIKYGGYGREGGEGDFFWTPLLLGGEDGDRSGACFLETRKRRFEHTGFALEKRSRKMGKWSKGKKEIKETIPFDQTECFAHKCLSHWSLVIIVSQLYYGVSLYHLHSSLRGAFFPQCAAAAAVLSFFRAAIIVF